MEFSVHHVREMFSDPAQFVRAGMVLIMWFAAGAYIASSFTGSLQPDASHLAAVLSGFAMAILSAIVRLR